MDMDQFKMGGNMSTETSETKKVVEIDCSTGIEVVRDMTNEEIEYQEQVNVEFEVREAAKIQEEEQRAASKASAKAKLSALGLTEEEISAITN
jgi:hypothetical protein